MTDTDRLLRLAKVRRLAASGEAQAVRERARLTVPEIAAVVGVTESAVSRWEGGSRKDRGAGAAVPGAARGARGRDRGRRRGGVCVSRPRLDELPDVLTAADVAAVTGLGENLVYRLLGRGELPGRKLGGRWIVSRAALERALGVPDDEDEPAEPELRAVE